MAFAFFKCNYHTQNIAEIGARHLVKLFDSQTLTTGATNI